MTWRTVTSFALPLSVAGCAHEPTHPAPPTESGERLFQSLCSSCHGTAAQGDGPIAPLIKTGVPDLTLLARRNGGTFPTEAVRRTIDGRFDRPAHSARVGYIQSLQR